MSVDFTTVTACGECCVGCKKYTSGFCQGCITSDGNVPEWAGSGGCPIHKCARAHKVKFCGLCGEFPCDRLLETITWNPNAAEHLRALAAKYRASVTASKTGE